MRRTYNDFKRDRFFGSYSRSLDEEIKDDLIRQVCGHSHNFQTLTVCSSETSSDEIRLVGEKLRRTDHFYQDPFLDLYHEAASVLLTYGSVEYEIEDELGFAYLMQPDSYRRLLWLEFQKTKYGHSRIVLPLGHIERAIIPRFGKRRWVSDQQLRRFAPTEHGTPCPVGLSANRYYAKHYDEAHAKHLCRESLYSLTADVGWTRAEMKPQLTDFYLAVRWLRQLEFVAEIQLVLRELITRIVSRVLAVGVTIEIGWSIAPEIIVSARRALFKGDAGPARRLDGFPVIYETLVAQ